MRQLSQQIIACIAIAILCGTPARAQSFADGGIGCGSGIAFLPTCVMAPSAEFRLQANQFASPSSSMRNGFTIADLTGGLSPNLEFFVRLGLLETASEQPNTPYGIGFKFLLPFAVPVFTHTALWAESSTNVQERYATYSFIDGARYGVLLARNEGSVTVTGIGGMTSMGGRVRPLAGAGASMYLGNALQVGVEGMYGYQGRTDAGGFATAMLQLFGHIGLKVAGGLVHTGSSTTQYFSAGLQLTSGTLGFAPVEAKKSDNLVPSFDDINNELRDDAGKGSKDEAQGRATPEKRLNASEEGSESVPKTAPEVSKDSSATSVPDASASPTPEKTELPSDSKTNTK
jgi:hypothetical protein